jgi:hypothetical protein
MVIEEMNVPHKRPTRLIPATQWNEHHQWPPLGGLRHLIFNAESNGFKKTHKPPAEPGV